MMTHDRVDVEIEAPRQSSRWRSGCRTAWSFFISSSRVVRVSPGLVFDLLLTDADQGGELPSPSASTTETPIPAVADQPPSVCDCRANVGMAKSVAFHGTDSKYHPLLSSDIKVVRAQKVEMAKSVGFLTTTQIEIVVSPNWLPATYSKLPLLALSHQI